MGTAPAASEGREPTLQDILRGAGGAKLTPGPGGGPAAPAISPPASPSMRMARAPEQTGRIARAPEQEYRVREPALGGK